MNTILLPAPVSPAGRPVFHEEESELKTFEDVGIHQKTHDDRDEVIVTGILILTNFRLIKLAQSSGNSIIGWEIRLKVVKGFSNVEKMFVPSKRMNLLINLGQQQHQLQLKFNKGGKIEFMELLERALERRSWEHIEKKAAEKVTPPPPPTFSLSNAGVGGILQKQNATMKNADSLAKAALTDLDSLAQKAREVVSVVQRYAAFMQEAKAASDEDGFSETTSQIVEVNEMETIMQNIGVISPVTRLSAGRLYHQQVARQLAELLLQQNRLKRLGGMITLTDLYCLYNRARGTELLSPDDLLNAVQMMSTLQLGMRMRVFPSGVRVIQLDSLDERAFDQTLIQFLESDEDAQRSGVNASVVARFFSLSVMVAKERLLDAERRGVLCRDESLEGLLYFPNRFK